MPKTPQQNGSTTPTAPVTAGDGQGPRGRKMLNLSPGRLNPKAGERTAESGQGEFCGQIWGAAGAVTEELSAKFKGTTNLVFHGAFAYKDAMGVLGQGTIAYLPSIISGSIKAALDKGQQSVEFAYEIWTEKDNREGARPGAFFYNAFNGLTDNWGIDSLAVAAGYIEPPPTMLPAPVYDQKTGEILPQAEIEDQRAAEVEDGLTRMMREGRGGAPEPATAGEHAAAAE